MVLNDFFRMIILPVVVLRLRKVVFCFFLGGGNGFLVANLLCLVCFYSAPIFAQVRFNSGPFIVSEGYYRATALTYSWLSSDTSTSSNPCYGFSSCRIGPGYQIDGNAAVIQFIDDVYVNSALKTAKGESAVAKLYNKFNTLGTFGLYPGVVEHSVPAESTLCWGLGWDTGNGASGLFSQTACVKGSELPGVVPPTSCKISVPDIVLDHGVLSSDAIVAMHDVGTIMNIQCDAAATAKISISEYPVRLSGGILSAVLVNNQTLNASRTFSLMTGSNNINLVSRLFAKGNVPLAAGEYTGTAVMTIEFP